MANGRHLENRYDVDHNSAVDDLISMKFGALTENRMLLAVKRSKSKSEVEFLNG